MAIKKKLVSSGRTTVRLPERLHHRAKLAATWSGAKLQEFIAEAVELHLSRAEAAMGAEMGEAAHRSPPTRKPR
jgi:hypothetical protein